MRFIPSFGGQAMTSKKSHPSLMDGFYKIPRAERAERIKNFCHLTEEEFSILSEKKNISSDIAEHLIENSLGFFQLPFGVATNFRIDGHDLFIPMAVEETSIIAAVSSTAKWIRSHGEIETFSHGHLGTGQIQFPSVQNVLIFRQIIEQNKKKLIDIGNSIVPGLIKRGGGVKEIEIRELSRPDVNGTMIILHILCDTCDAMGANLINQICENLKPILEEMTTEKIGLCILSNLTDKKLVGANVFLRGIDSELSHRIQEAALFAYLDPYRAATHNKGVLNGIDPVLIATGNDWRAVEAATHAYAARDGQYRSITNWEVKNGELLGKIEIPIAVGVVGGVTKLHPKANLCLKMLGVTHADELARICAAVGLVQNLGALKALCSVGIVEGHMKLHAANLALAAGATANEVEEVKLKLNAEIQAGRKVTLTKTKEILEELRSQNLHQLYPKAG